MNLYKLTKCFFVKSAAKSDLFKYKYPYHIELIDELDREDPSPTSKYLEWMINQVLYGSDKSDVISNIQYFHDKNQLFKNKDINSYDNKSLEDAIKDVESGREQKIIERGKSETIGNTDRFLIVRPDDKSACMRYGSDTKWCLTGSSLEHYDEYTAKENAIFYIIIDKESEFRSPMSKICYAFERDENNNIVNLNIWDSTNETISEGSVKRHLGEYYDEIARKIHNEAGNRPANKNYVDLKKIFEIKDSEELSNHFKYLDNTYSGNKNMIRYINEAKMKLIDGDIPDDIVILLAGEDNGFISKKLYRKYKDVILSSPVFAEKVDIIEDIDNMSPDDKVSMYMNSNDKYIKNYIRGMFVDISSDDISEDTQLILAKNNDISVRAHLASNPNISKRIELILLQDANDHVRSYLAKNPNISDETQLILVKDDFLLTRRELAGNKGISDEIKLILSKDRDNETRSNLASNPSIPEEIQLILAKSDDRTRYNLTSNPNISEKVQLILAKDPDNYVRHSLIGNPNVSEKIKTLIYEA